MLLRRHLFSDFLSETEERGGFSLLRCVLGKARFLLLPLPALLFPTFLACERDESSSAAENCAKGIIQAASLFIGSMTLHE